MISRATRELWRFGRIFSASDPQGGNKRSFKGFLEPLGTAETMSVRTKAGLMSAERFRLIAEPGESFPEGVSARISCAGTNFRLLSIREIYAGGELSHRECVLRKAEGSAG